MRMQTGLKLLARLDGSCRLARSACSETLAGCVLGNCQVASEMSPQSRCPGAPTARSTWGSESSVRAGRPGRPFSHHHARSYAAAALPDPLSDDSEEEEPGPRPGMAPLPDRIGFVGAGQMGEALIRGFTRSGVSTWEQICASVKSKERQSALSAMGLRVYGNALNGGAADLAANSDIIFLAVKPQYLDGVLEALRPHILPSHLVISIAAGIKVSGLEAALPEGTRVIRVMPNTPCLIGQAASAFVVGTHATEMDANKAYALMSSVGLTLQVEERMMDAVTGLSGSGPAYVFMMIEAMADGGVSAGLPRDKALALAAQTVVGAARMIFEANDDGLVTHPALLKDKVTSPGGTTITGLAELETSGVRGAFMRAVKAAAKRSEELG